jgi:membrane protein
VTAASTWDVLKESFLKWLGDNAQRLSASLAYYTVFSLAPLLIVMVGLAGLFLGQAAVKGEIQDQIASQIGPGAAAMIGNILKHAAGKGPDLFATIGGFALSVWGASGVFTELRDALNVICGCQPQAASGITGFLKSKVLPFLMVLGVGVLLLASFVLSWALSVARSFLTVELPLPIWVFQLFQFLVFTGIFTLLFAVMYVVLPARKIRWGHALRGGFVTAVLFTIGKTLVAIYLGSSTMVSSYGAAASLVLFLFWVYYSAQIFFFGAEYTYVYARRHEPKVRRSGG